MRNFRCILLCLSLLSVVGLMAGCSCGNPQDETKASFPAETSSAYQEETSSVYHEETSTQESSHPGTSSGDIYETGNGAHQTEDGLMEDVTDGLDQIGNDISDAVDDVVEETSAHRR